MELALLGSKGPLWNLVHDRSMNIVSIIASPRNYSPLILHLIHDLLYFVFSSQSSSLHRPVHMEGWF
jgi:hypothetical protein